MLDTVALTLFPGLMAYAAMSDLLTMKIANWLSLALIVGFFGLAFATGMPLATIGWHVLASLALLAVCFVLYCRKIIGGGDAKFAAATSLWFGFGQMPDYIVLTSLFGGILTAGFIGFRRLRLPRALRAVKWVRRLYRSVTRVPYGVALAAAGLVVYPHTSLWTNAVL